MYKVFELLLTGLWIPVSANIIWPGKISMKNRIINILLMQLSYCIILYNSYSETKAIYLFPVLGIIAYLFFGKKLHALLLVPAGYIIGVFANCLTNIGLRLLSISTGTYLSFCLVSIVLVLVSFGIRGLILLLRDKANIIESPKIVITAVIILATSCAAYLYIGFQIRYELIDAKYYYWYVGSYYVIAILSVIVFIVALKQIQKRERELREEENKRNLIEYTNQIEAMYKELRSFKHDYTNMLLTLSGYIDSNDMDGLRAFYQETILPTGEKINSGNYHLHKLSRIKDTALKGMLSAKFISSMSRGINLYIDIMDEVPDISMKLLDLTRVLGIYIDNAVEAALETSSKEVKFNIVVDSKAVVIVVANSYIPKGLSIDEIEKTSVSTKGEGRGIGLENAGKILNSYPNVYKYTEMKRDYFVQTLMIENESIRKRSKNSISGLFS